MIPHYLKTLEDVLVLIDPANDIGVEYNLYTTGTYEAGTLDFIKQNLKPGQTFIDVGSNIGWHALVAAKTIGSNGKLWCFEPSPKMFAILETNMEVNGFGNASCFQCGIGKKKEEVSFYLNDDVNKGESSALIQMEDAEEITIKVLPLDDIAEQQNIVPDMIKIDVEGMEELVLIGAKKTIEKHRPILILECASEIDEEKQYRKILIDYLMEMNDYNWFKSKNGKERINGLLPIKSREDFPLHDNVYGIPK